MFKIALLVLLAISPALAYECSCGTPALGVKNYTNTDITNGINKGFSVNPNPTTSGGSYPHRFNNRETLQFPFCTGTDLIEYPLNKGTAWTTALPPGTDRVVYLRGAAKTFCGCMTHKGAPSRNGFVLCTNRR